jgi:hypothetical protein
MQTDEIKKSSNEADTDVKSNQVEAISEQDNQSVAVHVQGLSMSAKTW